MPSNPVLWTPTPDQVAATNLASFIAAAPPQVTTYEELWHWSTNHINDFWALAWTELGVIASTSYDSVTAGEGMPGTQWFPGARLNYAENLLGGDADDLAVVSTGEGQSLKLLTKDELRRDVARVQAGLVQMGVGKGDRVCAFMPNTVQTLVTMLATAALGAVWSSTSPDFGATGVVDRFAQIEPTVLLVADGYRYNGRTYALQDKVADIVAALPTLLHCIVVDFAGTPIQISGPARHDYEHLVADGPNQPFFAQVPTDHPLFIMYSSGTTGVPKSIVHGHGGTLVKHLVEHQLHTDLRPGDVCMWFTTCGWMMWNWLVSALASRCTIVLYDGSPTHPDFGVLWRAAEEIGVTHFGTSPKFLSACQKHGVVPSEEGDLRGLRAVLSTGAPLNPEQFDWVYEHVSADIQLASVSGGTDLLGCFAGGAPTLPVRRGELQSRGLGMAVEAFDQSGQPVGVGTKGELVCTAPFPSMPIGFWGDPGDVRYREAYFDTNPGVWTHGDYIEIRPEGGVIIYGRSDTTLNPGGVRIGTAEIYRAIEGFEQIVDSVVVGRAHEGDVEVVLCLKMAEGAVLTEDLRSQIARAIRTSTTPRHVPTHIRSVPDIPYTISGKKVEKAVRRAIEGEPVDNTDAMANPEALGAFRDLFA